MYSFIVFLLPNLMGLKLFVHFNKTTKIIDFFQIFGLLTLFSNLVCMLFLIFLNKGEYNLIYYASTNFIFATKYICIMLISNIMLALLFTIVDKYIKIDIEVKNEKKKIVKSN